MKIDRRGIIHYVAQCDVCQWDACIFTDDTPTRQSVRDAVKKHVRKTGHDVTIEGGTSTTYSK